MKRMTFLTSWGVLATVAMTALAPMAASANGASRQNNKNQWRNLGFLGAAVAGYGLLEHNSTATLLGAAGAAYSANRYEQDRHSQSQAQANRDHRWYYRSNGNDYYGNNGGNGYYPSNGSSSYYDGNNNSRSNYHGDSNDRNCVTSGEQYQGQNERRDQDDHRDHQRDDR